MDSDLANHINNINSLHFFSIAVLTVLSHKLSQLVFTDPCERDMMAVIFPLRLMSMPQLEKLKAAAL